MQAHPLGRISPILEHVNTPNLLTLFGLGLSFFSVTFAIKGLFYAALLLMMFAGLADLFDGYVARKAQRTELQAEVGKQLDSIVDICSFGFAPAIFAYCYGLNGSLALIILLFFISANALRLAYFNSVGMNSEGGTSYYTGLPVTFSALFIPLFFTVSFFLPWTQEYVMRYILLALYTALSLAMVSKVQIPKPKGAWYGVFLAIALVLTGVYIWAMSR